MTAADVAAVEGRGHLTPLLGPLVFTYSNNLCSLLHDMVGQQCLANASSKTAIRFQILQQNNIPNSISTKNLPQTQMGVHRNHTTGSH